LIERLVARFNSPVEGRPTSRRGLVAQTVQVVAKGVPLGQPGVAGGPVLEQGIAVVAAIGRRRSQLAQESLPQGDIEEWNFILGQCRRAIIPGRAGPYLVIVR